MRKTMLTLAILLAFLACAPVSRAQEDQKEPIHFYRLTLVVQDVDSAGKPINSRSYATTVSTDRSSSGSIRTGSKMAIPTNKDGQLTYIDLGINFDIRRVQEEGRQLSLLLKAEITSNTPSENSALAPVIRHNQWEAPVLVPISKPTVIFSSDSLESKNAMQVVATVTPIS